MIPLESNDDKDFITQLYNQYYLLLKKKAYEITHDYTAVDDLINESFIQLIGKIDVLRSLDENKRTSYLVYTIKNTSINYLRKASGKTAKLYYGMEDDPIESLPDDNALVEEINLAKEIYEELAKAIGQLSDRDRHLLYNKYNLELSDNEISKIMNIPVNNIREYLTRARRRAYSILSKRKE